jgi:hypothetical protein
MNSPPSAQYAWPPIDSSGSLSNMITERSAGCEFEADDQTRQSSADHDDVAVHSRNVATPSVGRSRIALPWCSLAPEQVQRSRTAQKHRRMRPLVWAP